MRLVDMYNFYTHLLKIPDVSFLINVFSVMAHIVLQADIQTISWSEVIRRIGAIREENPLTAISSKARHTNNDTTNAKLDAHDVANRIMRQENYLIALFNKDLLDLRVPLPPALKRFITNEDGKGRMLTRALEWNLRFCLMEYLFDQHGRVRKVFLKSKNRAVLIEGYVHLTADLHLLLSGRAQIKTKIHFHGHLKCDLCTFHRPVPSHVFVLPLL